MIENMQIIRYGSNHNRKKLNYIPQLDRSAGRLQDPVIHGRNYKPRQGGKQKKQEVGSGKKSARKYKFQENMYE